MSTMIGRSERMRRGADCLKQLAQRSLDLHQETETKGYAFFSSSF